MDIKNFKKPVLISAGVLGSYALLGFFIIPAVLQHKLPEIIKTHTTRESSIGDVRFNPFSMELTLEEFEILHADNQQNFFRFDKFYTNLEVWSSIWNLMLSFDQVHLQHPSVKLEKNADGDLSIKDIIEANSESEETPEEPSSDEIFPLQIAELRILQGELLWLDEHLEHPVEQKFDPINLSLDEFTTRVNEGGHLGFSFDLHTGAHLAWTGTISVNPVHSKGYIKLANLNSHNIWKFLLQDRVNFEIREGRKLFETDYELSLVDEKFVINTKNGNFRIKDLLLTEKNGGAEAIAIPDFNVEGIDFDLEQQKIDIAAVTSTGTTVNGLINEKGQLNFSHLFDSPEHASTSVEKASEPELTQAAEASETVENDAPEEAKPWVIDVQNISLQGYQLNLDDVSKIQPLKLSVNPINLELSDYHLNIDEQLQMTAHSGNLAINNLQLQVANDEQPLVKIPAFNVNDTNIDLLKQEINIASVNSSSGQIRAWLDKQGVINYQSMLAAKHQAPQKTEPAPTSKEKTPRQQSDWKLNINEIAINQYDVQFQDFTTPKPANIKLAPIDIKIAAFNLLPGTSLPLDFNAVVNEKGKIHLSGTTVMDPLKVNLDVAIDKLALKSFQPYANQFAKLDFIKGDLNTTGKLAISNDEKSGLDLSFNGNTNIARLHTRDQIENKDFLKWKNLKLNNIAFDLQPVKLTIADILLQKPYAKVTIKEDKSVNISDLIVSDKQNKTTKDSAKQKNQSSDSNKLPKPYYKIGKIKIDKGYSDFSDFSLILPFVARLNDLHGEITGLSSTQKIKTGVNLTGKVYDLSPVTIDGEFSPDLSALDLGLQFKSMPLPFVTPYMADFAGYKIEKGKLSLDLDYKIVDKQLSAENKLLIDQFTLGEEVENPDAVSLPLNLAVALMKDKDGQINIDLPISGSLEDPDFSIGGLLLDAFMNLITKIVASPFQAIGSLIGSEEDLSVISFVAGSSELTTETSAKIDTIAQVLVDRPEFILEIRGTVIEPRDWPAMQEEALLEQLKNRKATELRKEGEKILAEYIELDEDDYQRLLTDLFFEKFPGLAERSFFGPPTFKNPEMGEFYSVAQKRLASIIKPDQDKLFVLASKRARNIASYIIQKGQVTNERIFILDGNIMKQDSGGDINTELSLNVS